MFYAQIPLRRPGFEQKKVIDLVVDQVAQQIGVMEFGHYSLTLYAAKSSIEIGGGDLLTHTVGLLNCLCSENER